MPPKKKKVLYAAIDMDKKELILKQDSVELRLSKSTYESIKPLLIAFGELDSEAGSDD